ncbi:MAG: hypothetical protein C0501_15085 [Isosphaera sp.]|nr:hypothetical protein [Isosphaera sp.]
MRFPGEPDPALVLVEIETYPDAEVDRQVLDDLMLIAVDRKAVPEVVCLVLKPKGNLTVAGVSERASPRGPTRVGGSWPVVRLCEVDAEELFAAGDVGLIPWVPLTRTTQTPDELMVRCRDRIATVPDRGDRQGLAAVTWILARSVFPDRDYQDLFGGQLMGLEVAFREGLEGIARDVGRAEGRAEAQRENVAAALEVRFGSVPADRIAALATVTDEVRLRALLRLAMTCPDLDSFVAGLTSEA